MGTARIDIKKPANKPTFSDFLHPISIVSRFFGIAPYKKNFEISKILTVYSALLSIFLFGNGVYIFFYIDSMFAHEKPSSMKLCMQKFMLTIMVYMSICCIYKSIAENEKLLWIIDEIEKIDVILHNHGLTTNERGCRIKLFVLVRILLTIVLTILFVVCKEFVNEFKGPVAALTFLSNSISHLVEYLHNTLIIAVKERLSLLRERVEKTNSGINEDVELEMCVALYNRLIEVGQAVNGMFGHQLLIIVSSIFVITTTNANDIYEDSTEFLKHFNMRLIPIIILNTYWGVVRLFELCSVISACEAAVKEAKEFTFSLYEKMIDQHLGDRGKNKKLWLHLTLKNEPYFTASGYFSLNYPLIHSVVAAATTYLVILIQFSQGQTHQ